MPEDEHFQKLLLAETDGKMLPTEIRPGPSWAVFRASSGRGERLVPEFGYLDVTWGWPAGYTHSRRHSLHEGTWETALELGHGYRCLGDDDSLGNLARLNAHRPGGPSHGPSPQARRSNQQRPVLLADGDGQRLHVHKALGRLRPTGVVAGIG